ncbi:acetyl-CoA carboxylase biotin carboxyl carrier protein [Peribacillus frigoritolerans]|jgi:acetyl-CoA carboxylase biotin carboxyl carrier protein|uniref:acetyl-CoA carboxylase biotin carboxyl carrier protein n=1 Tax=Peribacillus TaxID=2675229 RepID=UPI000BFC089C|nr:acetyl-CoA carboxylase biotin carboxyl carrier protein [Peribacillus frigoritolerans]MCD1159452.1 acetyl-CoA carboxylase biotin carboxyl carrier protein [Peribacillus castrilensis]PHD71439.1 acetyl-CoA carboxylase, biotin carboxyl carrier protein [Bacillus sp. AFS043905]TWD98401.1 biotin carboxyl carrier protein [Peribacillus frigoritolerans]
MFKMNDIKELIRAVDRSSIGELTIKGENEQQISISKQVNVGQVTLIEETQVPATIPVAPVKVEAAPIQKQEGIQTPSTTTEETSVHKITSPMVGTFYAAPSPDSDVYVRVGDQIKEDTVLCIVEAMKLMNELEAEVSGEIVEIFVESGQVVEYGQPLFLVKTA